MRERSAEGRRNVLGVTIAGQSAGNPGGARANRSVPPVECTMQCAIGGFRQRSLAAGPPAGWHRPSFWAHRAATKLCGQPPRHRGGAGSSTGSLRWKSSSVPARPLLAWKRVDRASSGLRWSRPAFGREEISTTGIGRSRMRLARKVRPSCAAFSTSRSARPDSVPYALRRHERIVGGADPPRCRGRVLISHQDLPHQGQE